MRTDLTLHVPSQPGVIDAALAASMPVAVIVALVVLAVWVLNRLRARSRALRDTAAQIQASIAAMRAEYVALMGHEPAEPVLFAPARPFRTVRSTEPEPSLTPKRWLQPELPVAAACMSDSYVEQAAGLFSTHWTTG